MLVTRRGDGPPLFAEVIGVYQWTPPPDAQLPAAVATHDGSMLGFQVRRSDTMHRETLTGFRYPHTIVVLGRWTGPGPAVTHVGAHRVESQRLALMPTMVRRHGVYSPMPVVRGVEMTYHLLSHDVGSDGDGPRG